MPLCHNYGTMAQARYYGTPKGAQQRWHSAINTEQWHRRGTMAHLKGHNYGAIDGNIEHLKRHKYGT